MSEVLFFKGNDWVVEYKLKQERFKNWIKEIPGTPHSGTPIPILLPYQSHKNPLKSRNGMGSGHGKGVPLSGAPWRNPWLEVDVEPKIGGETPKMDGENNGKPY